MKTQEFDDLLLMRAVESFLKKNQQKPEVKKTETKAEKSSDVILSAVIFGVVMTLLLFAVKAKM